MLVAELQALPRSPIGRRIRGRLFSLGEIYKIERVVANPATRRIMWHLRPHELPGLGLGDHEITTADGTVLRARVLDAEPDNWRPPLASAPLSERRL